ncbi:hypothetical protein DFJ77DRAFT_71779 [Powellomyces hirtus]|nr:hypothetical protein DFJ77DRAFT_71779 [Powellomyces hirtus]
MTTPTLQDKLNTGRAEKDKGNAAFKAGDIPQALRSYHTATLYLTGLDNASMAAFVPTAALTDEVKKDIKETLKACYSNMAACYLRQSNWSKCIAQTTKVITLDPSNAKAYFRRGQSHLELRDNVDAAYADLKKAAELAPQDSGIRDALAKATAEIRDQEMKSRAAFRGKLLG